MKRYKRVDNLAFEILLRMLDHNGVVNLLEMLQAAIAYDLSFTDENRVAIDRLLDTLNESIIASKEAYKGLGKAISNVQEYKRKTDARSQKRKIHKVD